MIIDFIKNNKKSVAVFLIVFIFILISGFVILFSSKKTNNPIPVDQSPTPEVSSTGLAPDASVAYDSDSTKKMIDTLVNRPALLSSDQKIRNDLINSLPNHSGILNQTQDYKLQYVKSPDEFMTEILTSNINQDKQEAVDWLKSKGLSQDGVCKLPLIFYLNSNVLESLRGSNMTFSPLPEGC